ncbi:hypothetical protein Nmel_015156, partial [Mimus melanotis]
MWLFPWCQMALVSGRCYLLLPECFSACFSPKLFLVWPSMPLFGIMVCFFFSFFLWAWGKQDAEDKAFEPG